MTTTTSDQLLVDLLMEQYEQLRALAMRLGAMGAPPPITVDTAALARALAAELASLVGREVVVPAPVVHQPPIDVTPVGEMVAAAVASLREAVAAMPVPQVDTSELARLLEARVGEGGGGPTYMPAAVRQRLRNTAGDEINPATEDTLARLADGLASYDVRFDYGARTDSNPERIGKAPAGSATSAEVWTIQTFTYDASARPTLIGVATGQAWS